MDTQPDAGAAPDDPAALLRVGTPERREAQEALETHRLEKRLDSAEFERRMLACDQVVTRAQLMAIFADLPEPRPELSPPSTHRPEAEEDMPPLAVAGCLTLGLGLPVAIVLGVVYGAWWALAVPVAVTVAMTYVEHLRTRRPGNVGGAEP